jgi:hypothetical protein
MKWFYIVFFHVFKKYYKNGHYKNDIPWLTASGIVGVSVYFYLFSLYIITHYISYGYLLARLDKNFVIPIGLAIVLGTIIFFIWNKKYLMIFNSFKDKYSKDSLSQTLSWIFVFAPYLLFVVLVMLLKDT